MTKEQIDNTFTYHAPKNDQTGGITPMTFEEILIAKTAAHETFWNKTTKEYEAAFRAKQEAIFKARFPKKKKFDLKLIEADGEYVALLTAAKLEAKNISDAFHTQQKAWEDELNTLAETTELPASDQMVMVDSVHAHWPNQTSPHTYSRAYAESKADYARHYGVEVEVRLFQDEYLPGKFSEKYGVWMKTTPMGWEILKRRAGVGMKEWLRLCWKRGANPRVFNPFLPHGLEEKWGITYQGEYK